MMGDVFGLDDGERDEDVVRAMELRNLAVFAYEIGEPPRAEAARHAWWAMCARELDARVGPHRVVNSDDYEDRTMAHVMVDAGMFRSVGEAKRNGWNRPVAVGLYRVGKRQPVLVA